MKFSDLVEILERELGRDQARRAVDALCREAAGEEVYVPRRVGRPEIRVTDTAATVAVRYRISHRAARNWVTRWKES